MKNKVKFNGFGFLTNQSILAKALKGKFENFLKISTSKHL